mgnify:CR=1 FL=1
MENRGRACKKGRERGGEEKEKRCGRVLDGVVHLTDRGFELQLVPPDIPFKALKRGDV